MSDQQFLAQLMHDLMQSVLKLTPEQLKNLRSNDYQLSLSVKKINARAKVKRNAVINDAQPPAVALGKVNAAKPSRKTNEARVARGKNKSITNDAMQILSDQLSDLHERRKATRIIEGVLTTKAQLSAYAAFIGVSHAKNVTKDKLVEKLVDAVINNNQTKKVLAG